MTLTVISKKTLLDLQNGDTKAFEEIYRAYVGKVYHFVLSLLHDHYLAEEATQILFIKIWERHETIDPERNFESYLFTISRHLSYKLTEEMINRMERLSSLNPPEEETTHSPQLELEAQSLQQHIDRIVEQFPNTRRKIFRLSRVEHLSHKEIAQHLNISERTVETHIYRALIEIKTKLTDRVVITTLFLLSQITNKC